MNKTYFSQKQWTPDEVRIVFRAKNLNDAAEQLHRSANAVQRVRSAYKFWKRRGFDEDKKTLGRGLIEVYKIMDAEGIKMTTIKSQFSKGGE